MPSNTSAFGVCALSLAACWPRCFAQDNSTYSLGRLSDWDYLCGEYSTPCQKVAHIPYGPDIWLSTEWSYGGDYSFSRRERGFFNRTACETGEPWLELSYEGDWSDIGAARNSPASHAKIDVKSVWLKLWQEKVCLEQVDGDIRCMNTSSAIQTLCPCNGWDWGNDGQPRQRNIGMFCMPREQCPIIHEVYLQQSHHQSYSADSTQACFSPPSSGKTRGWDYPDPEICYEKQSPGRCSTPVAGSMRQCHHVLLQVTLLMIVWPAGL